VRRVVRDAVAMVGLIVVLAGANWWTSDHDAQADLSALHRFTLSTDTRRLIAAVHAPLRVTVFLNTTGPDANDARFLLDRYHELNHRITYEVADPDADPELARRFGITDYDTVVLQYKGRRVEAPDAEELELSTGILQLLQGRSTKVCALTGHDEDDLGDTSPSGFSEVATLLQDNDYATVPLDLATGLNPTVPASCAAVLIDGPRNGLAPNEISAINAYAQAGGRLLVLATPLSNADPNPILEPWGVHFLGGLVVDPNRAEGTDLSNLIIEDLPSASPVDLDVTRLEFPAPGALETTSDAVNGLTVEDLAVTSSGSYVAPDPSATIGFEPGDAGGPIVVAAAADDSRVVSGTQPGVPGPSIAGASHIVRTRVLVTGTDIWATNEFLDDLGNRRFLINGLAWLTERDQLVVATDRPDQAPGLPLTGERQQQIIEIAVVGIPLGILALGAARALVRRRRT